MSGSLSDDVSDFVNNARFLSVGDTVDTSTGSGSQRIDGDKAGVVGNRVESLKWVVDNRPRLLLYGGEAMGEKLRSLDDVKGVVDDVLRSLSALGMPGNVGTLGTCSS